jgi:iron complex outermembrane receptor protein
MQAGASLGDRHVDWAWCLNVHYFDSNAQPLTFANRLVSAGTYGNGGMPVTGAFAGRNPANRDWLILGEGGQIHPLRDHLKIRLAYAANARLTASWRRPVMPALPGSTCRAA